VLSELYDVELKFDVSEGRNIEYHLLTYDQDSVSIALTRNWQIAEIERQAPGAQSLNPPPCRASE